MKETFNRCERRLKSLAEDLAELQRRSAQQRIQAAIEEASRRVSRLQPGRTDLLKPYQVESAITRIGEGEPVLSISRSLRCGCTALYRACCSRNGSISLTISQ